jgi:hypothetical protein
VHLTPRKDLGKGAFQFGYAKMATAQRTQNRVAQNRVGPPYITVIQLLSMNFSLQSRLMSLF